MGFNVCWDLLRWCLPSVESKESRQYLNGGASRNYGTIDPNKSTIAAQQALTSSNKGKSVHFYGFVKVVTLSEEEIEKDDLFFNNDDYKRMKEERMGEIRAFIIANPEITSAKQAVAAFLKSEKLTTE